MRKKCEGMQREMKSQKINSTNSSFYLRAVVFLLASVCVLGCSAHNVKAADSTAQATFVSPKVAGESLQAASRAQDKDALGHIFGSRSSPIVNSGDPAEDKAALQSFVAKYDRMNRWVTMTDGSRVLYIGSDNYAFPIPLVQDSESRWHFDTTAGEREILARRIGRNELLAIDASTSIANAEELYRRRFKEYTQTILGSPEKEDGLHWEVPQDQSPSPLGRLGNFAGIAASSAVNGAPVFDGYSFRILSAQGDKAKGGAKSYMIGGKMTAGFAVIATPVKYQDSGIMTFIVSRDGVVYQKDLGPNTINTAASITSYNPTEGWTPAE
jgi:Protein of unknown function (DUF2950)